MDESKQAGQPLRRLDNDREVVGHGELSPIGVEQQTGTANILIVQAQFGAWPLLIVLQR